MFTLRKKEERGTTHFDWLNSFHTFSFGNYYDPQHMGFSDLRVINDDTVLPGGGFGTHGHKDMEILTLVLSGSLEHRDSLGTGSIIKPGDLQKMSAGSGVKHSEYNPSKEEEVHFLQIWIMPNALGVKPSYEQRFFDLSKSLGTFTLLASPDGQNESISIHQDAKMYQTLLNQDTLAEYPLSPEKVYWLHAAKGKIFVQGTLLQEGDGVAIAKESGMLSLKGILSESLVLLFELTP
jgi:redox-sensitive bicupin YhaK (pirin superfamily)